MNGLPTAVTRTTQIVTNLDLVATVATVATALQHGAFSRCHPIKKVATSGNTHLSFNIRGGYNSAVWLSPLPQKNGWQQNGNEKDGWRPRITRVLPPLPRLPHFLKPQQHVYVCEASCPGNPEHAAQVPRTSLKMALSFFGGNKGNGGTPSKTVACGCSPLLSVWGTGGTQTCFSIGTAFASPAFERFLSPIKKHGVQSPPLEASETVGVPTVPPFPRFFSTGTYGQTWMLVEVMP